MASASRRRGSGDRAGSAARGRRLPWLAASGRMMRRSSWRGVARPAVVSRHDLRWRDYGTPLRVRPSIFGRRRAATRGQPAAEIHTLGSPPLLAAVLSASVRHGARPAAPGEFTLRAFLAGRIDLTQAEAVLGVIDAHGKQQFRRGAEQLAGGLAAPLGRLRVGLLDLLAQLEAGLDFVEEDIEFITAAEIAAQLTRRRGRS